MLTYIPATTFFRSKNNTIVIIINATSMIIIILVFNKNLDFDIFFLQKTKILFFIISLIFYNSELSLN